METTTCPKCNGSRKLMRYSHIAEGDCFECKATGRVTTGHSALVDIGGPDHEMTAERAIDQLRVFYVCARRQGAAWFDARSEEESGVGPCAVRWYASHLDATTAARVIASFDALTAISD